MNAHSSKLNKMRLPCPRCHAPASIDARECVCGYKFVADHEPQIAAKMPDLDKVVPGFTSSVHKFPLRGEKSEKFDQPAIKETVVFAIPEAETETIIRTAKPESVTIGNQRIVINEQAVSMAGLTTVVSQEPIPARAVWFGLGLKRTIVATVAAVILAAFGFLTFYLSDSLAKLNVPSSSSSQTNSHSAGNESAIRLLSEQGTDETVATESNTTTDTVNESEKAIEQGVDQQPSKPQTETGKEQLTAESSSNEKGVNADDPKVVKSESAEIKTSAANSQNNSAAATARCADGTYSYNKTRSGVCSYRGGVAEWLDGGKPISTTKTTPGTPIKTQTDAKTSGNVRKFILGARGGCYYVSESGNKNYVDKSFCN